MTDRPDRQHHISRCRSDGCRAPIIWAIVAKSGRGVPLDAERDTNGKCYIVDYAEDGRPIVEYATAESPAPPGVERHSSHFETCPDAASWSKSKGAKK